MLEQYLQHWRDWGLREAPVPVRQLGGGLTNQSFLLRSGRRDFVLRINRSDGSAMGIDRQREQDILAQVSAAGIAPEVVFNSPAQGVLLSAWVDGKMWRRGELDRARRHRLLALMERVHDLTLQQPAYDYVAQAELYWQSLLRSGNPLDDSLCRLRERILPLVAEFQSACRCDSLCHHDPVTANFIDAGDRWYLIDWEYAGRGCRAFDLAALAVEWDMNPEQLHPVSADIPCDRQLAGEVYAYLCSLWCALNR